MTEMTWTSMRIGGALPANRRKELLEAIGNDFSNSDVDDIDAAIKEGRAFEVSGEVNFGNAEEVETFCQTHGLIYWSTWAAKCGAFDSGVKRWTPEHGEQECGGNDNGEPTFALQELLKHFDDGLSLGQVVERLAAFSEDAVPALTLGPNYVLVNPNEPDPDLAQPAYLSMWLRTNEAHARKIIMGAERDLGTLDNGQRRDLLLDNTTWSSFRAFEMVAYIEKLDETVEVA